MQEARYRIAVTVLAAAFTVAGVAGCSDQESDDQGQPQDQGTRAAPDKSQGSDRSRPNTDEVDVAPNLPGATVVLTDPKTGVRMTVPADWHTTDQSLTPRLGGTAGSLAAGTSPLRPGPKEACSNSPDQPQVEIGPTDALVHVDVRASEDPSLAGERPEHFQLLEQTRPVEPDRPASGQVFPWNCLNRVGIVGVWTFFGDGGRVLYVTAVVGKDAADRTRSETLGVLESLNTRG